MFTWLNKQGVRSDRGFVVQFTGRFSAEYRDQGKVLKFYVEDGTVGGQPAILVDPDAFQHWDGETATIDPDEQLKMFRNLREAVEFQGLKLSIERAVGPAEAPELFKPWRRS
jgi:hypothetical protein